MEARFPENPHSVEGGEHHEKKTVMKRAKDKASKIKSSMMSKMAHGHHAEGDHEHDNDNDVMSEEGEVYEEAEEEKEAAPEAHGAPMYESEAARQFAGGRDEKLGPGKAMSTTTVEDPSRPKEKRVGSTEASDESQLSDPSTDTGTSDDERRNISRDRDENIDPQTVTSRATAGSVEEDLSASKALTGTPAAATQPSHPSDPYPKGGDEVGESPLLSSFQDMAVSDKPKGTEGVVESPPTRSHVQGEPDKPLQDAPKEGTEEQMSSSYTNKISSTAPAANDAAVSGAIGSAKSKDAEGVLESPPAGSHDQFSPDKPQQDTPKEGTEEQKSSSYKDKISSTAATAKDAAVSGAIGSAVYGKKIASTVYGKVSETGTAIMGKGMNQEGKNDDIKTRQPANGVLDKDKGVSVKEYVVGKLKPGDEDRALSEVISDAMHTKKQEAVGGAPEGVKGPEQGSSEDVKGPEQGSSEDVKGPEQGSSEDAKGSGSEKGMVEKIKGAVTSWIGAGSTAGAARDSPTTTGSARDSPTGSAARDSPTTTMADADSNGKEA